MFGDAEMVSAIFHPTADCCFCGAGVGVQGPVSYARVLLWTTAPASKQLVGLCFSLLLLLHFLLMTESLSYAKVWQVVNIQ